MRRRRKLLLFSASCSIFVTVYIIIFGENYNTVEEYVRPFSEKCSSTTSAKIINEVCLNYTNGIAYGSLCQDLCVKKSVEIKLCIHHSTTYVLVGENNGENIVIKKKKVQNIGTTLNIFEDSIRGLTDKEDIDVAYRERFEDEVRSIHGEDSRQVLKQNFQRISQLLFGKQIEELTIEEMRKSWFLVGQEELIVMALHQDLDSFPKLKGTCGSVYAIEGVKPLSDFFPQIRPSMPWQRRAIIAKSFLTLIKDFENSGVGRLHHCDIQETNFGITKDLKVKAIDVDLIYSSDRINEIFPHQDCSSDNECDFIDCNSKCDLKTKKCTKEQTTNNLMIMCRDIFYPQWPMNGLLSNFQPVSIKNRLRLLLEHCKSSTFGKLSMDHEIVQNVMNELEEILNDSLTL